MSRFRSVLCETTTQSQIEDRKNIEYKFVSKFELMELRPSIQENYVNNKMARISLFSKLLHNLHSMSNRSCARWTTDDTVLAYAIYSISEERLEISEDVYLLLTTRH